MVTHAVMQMDAGVMISNVSGVIEFVNPAFERYSGYCAAEIVGQMYDMVCSGEPPPGFFAELWQTRSNGDRFHATFINRRKSGAIYYEEKTITPIRHAGAEITHFMSTGQDVTSRVLADAWLVCLADYDRLSGLPNRRLFLEYLAQAISRCRRRSTRLSLLIVDLDRFKRINNALGNSIGDKVLSKVSARLRESVSEQDFVARLGGDEFAILSEGFDSRTAGMRIVEVLNAAFLRPFDIEGRVLYSAISVGIATYPDDGGDIDSLVRHAHIAMHHAKSLGRSTSASFSSVMEGTMVEDLSMEVSLRHALDNDEFSICYQAVVRPGDRQVLAVEALLRWNSPVHGAVPPTRFIPMLEETGLISSVGRWVLETACAEIKSLELQGLAPVILAVNLSGRQFRDGNLIGDVKRILHLTGLPPERLELEITESILIDAPLAIRTLEALAALGIRLAIDDFGTGYSSLSYLRRFPITTLKIDRSFVMEMETCPGAVAIVKTIFSLADNLGLEVVAEGVESAEQLERLIAFGCARVQGYLFSRPVPLVAIAELLMADSRGMPRGDRALRGKHSSEVVEQAQGLSLPEHLQSGAGHGGS